ncbi:hypothetical protein EDD22DRAFT_849868 [Suillus occidentalis]|nr:hypothetical protein EDD22DRAFT_849868 [Suillus occidentalis]
MAITLSQTDLEKIEVLDRGKNNWGIWFDKMEKYLLLKHGGGYILRLIMHPNPSIDPSSMSHWDLNNLCIIVALHTWSSSEEQEFLHTYTNTYLAWNALKSCHEKYLSDVVQCIYAIGLPKENDFLTIMMLNTISDDLPYVRNHIANVLSISTTTTIYSPSNICSCLDVEQQLINTTKGSRDVALLANSHSYCCTNCNSWGHYAKDCFSKGGSMEVKHKKVFAQKHIAHESNSKGAKPTTKPVSIGKPGAIHYDTGGHIYILDGKTHEAMYIATPPAAPPSMSSDTESCEFTGLACDSIISAFIYELSEHDCDELALYFTLVS